MKKALSIVLVMLLTLGVLPTYSLPALGAENDVGISINVEDEIQAKNDTQAAQNDLDAVEDKLEGTESSEIVLEDEVESSATAKAASNYITGDNVTRAQWLHNIVYLFGLDVKPEEYPDLYFPDVSEGTEYYSDIMIATKYGLIEVEAGEPLKPTDPLTRGFAAQTLNFMLGIQLAEGESYLFSDTTGYDHCDDAQAILNQGWLTLANGRFDPDRQITSTELDAMLNGAEEIVNARNTSGNVSSFTFADYVKVIPESVTVEYYDGGLILDGYNGEINPGDTFAVYYQNLAYTYVAVSVEQIDNGLCIDTEKAPDSAVVDGEFSGEINPELTAVGASGAQTLRLIDGRTATFSPTRSVTYKDGTVSFNQSISVGSSLSGNVSGKIKNIRVSSEKVGGQRSFTMTGTIDVSASATVDALSGESHSIFLGGASLGPVGDIGIVLDYKFQASLNYTLSSKFTIIVEYRNGKFYTTSNFENPDSCISAEGEISATLQAEAKLDFGFIGKASASFGVGPRINAGVKKYSSGTPAQCISISGYLYMGGRVYADFIGIKSYSKDFTVFNEKNSPVRVYEHIENGIPVPSCTRGKDTGTTSGTYRPTKYVTPSTSRYYSSRQKNASSTGYAGGGGTQPVVIWDTETNDDGTVTVTGWHGNASILNIPETIDGKTVTTIGEGAFADNKTIRYVIMPDTVTKMNGRAFAWCTNLQNVILSRSLAVIGYSEFYGTALTRLDLPEGLTTIGANAFRECSTLESVYIPSTLDKVDWPFWDCAKLNSVTFGNGISIIPESLFRNCSGLTHIEIPETVKEIEGVAFSGCTNLKSAVLSKSLTEIGYSAFYGTALTRLDLPEGLTTIGANAFRECSALESVYIPSTLEKADWPFWECNKLGTVTLGSNITRIPDSLFRQCTGLTHIEIPSAVTEIGDTAFSMCANLQSVVFSHSLKKIGSSAFHSTALVQVSLPEGLTEIGANAFREIHALESVYIPSTLEKADWPFWECDKLGTVTFGNGISKVPERLFQKCVGLTQIEIPGSVTRIEDYAFLDCENLMSTSIGKWVDTIGYGSYSGCISLTDVHYGGTKSQWEVISIDTNNDPLKSATIHYNADIPNTPDTKPEPTPTPGPTDKPTPTPPVTPTPGPTSTPKFTDVKSGAYYYDAVIWAVEKGITSGTGNNKFSPDASCTRGQIVTFLWRAAGSPDPVSSANPFSDVKLGDYFYNAVLWAVENNITSGIGGGRFGPGEACTRGQAVTFLWRAEKSPNVSAGSSFSDVKSGSYYEKAVDWAVSKNVTSGTGNGEFSPDVSCTRGQIVTFLYRANG